MNLCLNHNKDTEFVVNKFFLEDNETRVLSMLNDSQTFLV